MKWEITIKNDMGNNNNAHLTAHERFQSVLDVREQHESELTDTELNFWVNLL